MGFALDSFINDIANSTSLNSIFNNPIYTAILIVAIVLLIIFVMFRTEVDESDYSFWTLLFRSGFYLILPIMMIVFVHYKNVERDYDSRYESKTLNDVVLAGMGKKDPNQVTGKGEVVVEITKPSKNNSKENIKVNSKDVEGNDKDDNGESGAFINKPTLQTELSDE